MNFIEQIRQFIREHPELIEADGPPGDEPLDRARRHFGGSLPDSLEQYLATFGKLAVPPDEFAGLSAADPDGKLHDDIVRMHQDLTANHNMPTGWIPLLSEEGDSYLVLVPGESDDAVVRWDPFHNVTWPLNRALPELLVERCEWLIEDETQEWTGWEERIATCNWFANVGTGEIAGAQRVHAWEDVAEWLASEEYQKAKQFSKNELQRVLKRGGIQSVWQQKFEELERTIDRLLARSIVPAVKPGLPERIIDDFRDHALTLLVTFPFMGPDYDALDRRMVELYLDGYCPCGFQGRYPRGTFIVY